MSPEDQIRAATEALQRGDAVQGLELVHAVARTFGDRKDLYLRASNGLVGAGQIAAALLLLEQALVKFPSSGAILDGFGRASARAKDAAMAGDVLSDIVARLPGSADLLANLGRLLLGQGELATALIALQRAHALTGDELRLLAALGACLFQLNRKDEAVDALGRAAKLEPDNADIRHMYASFSGADVSTAPAAFVKNLFDSYAASFDKDLVGKLKYRTPQDVVAILKSVRPDAAAFTCFLDVGCGTGLVADALNTHYRIPTKVGVDLSRKMIEVARGKNLYQELLCGDASDILRGIDNSFDLIAAIDTAIYIGDLALLTAAVAERLAPGGLYVYSIETLESGTYKLLPSQRFAHSVAYVENTAAPVGLKPLTGMETVIRLHEGKPLPGYVGVLIKA